MIKLVSLGVKTKENYISLLILHKFYNNLFKIFLGSVASNSQYFILFYSLIQSFNKINFKYIRKCINN